MSKIDHHMRFQPSRLRSRHASLMVPCTLLFEITPFIFLMRMATLKNTLIQSYSCKTRSSVLIAKKGSHSFCLAEFLHFCGLGLSLEPFVHPPGSVLQRFKLLLGPEHNGRSSDQILPVSIRRDQCLKR